MKKQLFAGITAVMTLNGVLAVGQPNVDAAKLKKGMPKALIGTWKRGTGQNSSRYHGSKYDYWVQPFQASAYGGKVRSHKYLGKHTYKVYYTEMLTQQHKHLYFHWYSKHKVGLKYSVHSKYSVFYR
ncbi:hypothetical protein [Lentilactobacillus sp. Marseille-Q4993]|uniref:hypothetical protein n=1 Tax=Lentilactobacillus sp. Marseille-Q4993 TaxID=3039492 RepID=UPI0024BCCD42|nr:hypothetical protein [Lentilactobacillus sp. Marseille-Q4993]